MGNSSVNRRDANTVAQRQPSAPLFSEHTRQAIVNTLITVLAAAAFAAAASGAYLLAQHNYALLSGFENTVGLVVTSSYVLLASGLTLCIINYTNKEAPKKQAPLTGQPVAAPATTQSAAEKTTYPLPDLASLKSPDDKQLKHLAKKLKEGEYCEIRSPSNCPVILVRDRLFVFDERGSNCSIFDINTSALPSDPNLPDYTAVRTLLKDYRDVTADVGARLEDFPFVLEVETARELCPFIGSKEYTTYTLPNGEKREAHAGGNYVNHFANNGKEDMYYTPANTPANRHWGQKSFIDLLAEVRSSGFTFVSHETLRARLEQDKAQKASAGANKGSGVASSASAPASAKDPAASPAPAPAPAPAASAPPSGAPTSAPMPEPASASSAAPASPPSPPQPPAEPFVAPAPAPAPSQAPASATAEAASPASVASTPAAGQSGPTYFKMTQSMQNFMAARMHPYTYFFCEVDKQKRIVVRNEMNQLKVYTDLSKLNTLGPSFKEVTFSDLEHRLLEGEVRTLTDRLQPNEFVFAAHAFSTMTAILCTKSADGRLSIYYYDVLGQEFIVPPAGNQFVPRPGNSLHSAGAFYNDPNNGWTGRSVSQLLLGLRS